MYESEANKIKTAVKSAYSEMVEQQHGCCGGAGHAVMKGRLVQLAGYAEDELARLPDDAVVNAFGCGNPLALCGVKEGDVVLDIGSGAGIDCFLAAQLVGPSGRVIGIDMTPAMLEKARANAKRYGYTNVEFRAGDAENMPVDDASVDWIISNCVINLAPDKDKVFAEMARVLEPGGRFSVSDIVLGAKLPQEIKSSIAALVGCIAGALPEAEYLEKMRRAGLADVKVEERLVYTREQLACFGEDALSEVPIRDRISNVEELLAKMDGQIWNAKITGRRRGGPPRCGKH